MKLRRLRMNRKKIFFTSDLHIGHANSINFDNRPFRDLDDMHSSLIRRFNSTVPRDGVTYFLGDIGVCSQKVAKEFLSKLNGTKILIAGNHDKGMNANYNLGFDCVLGGAVLFIVGEKVTLSHYPLLGVFREDVSEMRGAKEGDNWHGELKHSPKCFKDEGQFHLHGHIHSPNGGKSKKILDRQYDIGVTSNKYSPVSISTIESWIVLTKRKELTDK